MDDLLHSNIPEYTVSEISQDIKATVENAFPYIRVRGEISGYKVAPSGHVYYNLKDDNALIAAVCWNGRNRSFGFQPEDGLEVICLGRITTYGARSNYQLVVEHMEVAGQGALLALLEKRKEELAKEGLFDEGRKKPLPFLPDRIGIITSPTGAVIQDMLHRIEDRFPRHVLLWPVMVQGDGAAEQISAAIEGFNDIPEGDLRRPDVIIVARGGGSIEDLWAFNEEIVVRATANSSIPLVSAVGHETDTTLIDFASDKRAPTPTAAAEFILPVRMELQAYVQDLDNKLSFSILRHFHQLGENIIALSRGLSSPQRLLEFSSQRLDDLGQRFYQSWSVCIEASSQQLELLVSKLIKPTSLIEQKQQELLYLLDRLNKIKTHRLDQHHLQLTQLSKLLESYCYQNVLQRGFALVRDKKGSILRSNAGLKENDSLDIEFAEGQVNAFVSSDLPKKARPNTKQATLKPKKPKKKNTSISDPRQYSILDL